MFQLPQATVVLFDTTLQTRSSGGSRSFWQWCACQMLARPPLHVPPCEQHRPLAPVARHF
jgi:hypothetical protein